MNQTFWKGKKVFLTGHTGFKGTWLSLMLETLGAIVCGYALEPESNFFPMTSPKLEKNCYGNITEKDKLCQTICDFKPEIVIHFASHSTLNKSHIITDYIFNTNVMGVVDLLEAVRHNPQIKAVLVVTSDKCYSNMESIAAYEEDSMLGAQDPYSTSKACQELVSECYRKSFFSCNQMNIPIATGRASNVLGGGDYNLDRLLPSLINSFIHNEKAIIRNPMAIRPWQNVLDVLGGYLILIEHMQAEGNADGIYSSAFNFGPREDGFLTVRALAEKLAVNFPGAQIEVCDSKQQVKETNVLKISSKKAESLLGWKPLYTMQETLNMVAAFAIREAKGERIRDICMEFIQTYIDA